MMYTRLFFLILMICPVMASNPLTPYEPELQRLSQFLSNEQGVNLEGQGVHQFNARIRPFAPLIQKCNQALLLNVQHNGIETLNLINQLRKKIGLGDEFENEINQLKNYLQRGSDFDGETTMHITEMLSAFWNYMQYTDPYMQQGLMSQFFFYMQQNTLEAGGCFPGYAGRLMAMNGQIILNYHEILKVETNQADLVSRGIPPANLGLCEKLDLIAKHKGL